MSRTPRTVGSSSCANTIDVSAAIIANATATAKIAMRCGLAGLSGSDG